MPLEEQPRRHLAAALSERAMQSRPMPGLIGMLPEIAITVYQIASYIFDTELA
jgi:hypothetical protein